MIDPDTPISTQQTIVTADNLQQVAEDIHMDPEELQDMLDVYNWAGRPLVVVVLQKED